MTAETSVRSESETEPDRRTASGFREYRAPRHHAQALIEPRLGDAGALLRANRQRASDSFWDSLRRDAREQLFHDALRYTAAYRDVDWARPLKDAPIVMAGHQPVLFHSGVWFKNFVLHELGQRLGALPINLVIDNDVAVDSSIRIPTVDPPTGLVRQAVVPYDVSAGGLPFEQTTIRDRGLFDQFDRAVEKTVQPLIADPCVGALWHHARAAIDRCGVAGCALAQARHALEGEIGLRTLELPHGVVCRGRAFARFVLSVLTELPRFQQCYNDATSFYRRVHGIRSSAHPVPNLDQQEQWFEAPLWVYGNDSPNRRPVWVRLSDQRLVLSDRVERELEIELDDEDRAAEQLAAAISPNQKFRPRALLTTMYARLVLSDLFLHGIGGGKYDQLGDQIIRAFFEIEPPRFMVVSATVCLPNVEHEDYEAEQQRLRSEIRATQFQPERFADRARLDPQLVQRKRELLSDIPPRGRKQAWHDEVTRINEQLSASLEELRGSLRVQLARNSKNLGSQKVLASREHPFCVYPLQELTETFRGILSRA